MSKFPRFSEAELRQISDYTSAVIESLFLQSGQAVAPGVFFSEDFCLNYDDQIIKFNAESFQSWANKSFPLMSSWTAVNFAAICRNSRSKSFRRNLIEKSGCQVGNHWLVKQTVPAGVKLTLHDGEHRGRCFFDGDIHIPTLFDPKNGETWMSLTPMEVGTCREGVRLSQGNVLVGGLGLGWQLQRILEKPFVDRVVCVELNKNLIDFVGTPLLERYGERLEITQANVWDYLHGLKTHTFSPPHFDSYILDVWPDYGDASRDRQFQRLKRWGKEQGCIVWGWGDMIF